MRYRRYCPFNKKGRALRYLSHFTCRLHLRCSCTSRICYVRHVAKPFISFALHAQSTPHIHTSTLAYQASHTYKHTRLLTHLLIRSLTQNMPNLGDIFLDFEAEATTGKIESFHSFIGDGWALLCSHPADFTPVCTTELAALIQIEPEFRARNCKIAVVSCDTVEDHLRWSNDVLAHASGSDEKVVPDGDAKLPFPIIADPTRSLAVALGMLDPVEKDKAGLPLTARAVFFIGPDKRLKASLLYPATTGRSFPELLRVLDSLQLTATKRVATPANWAQGGKCMVLPSVSSEEASKIFPGGVETLKVPSGKVYMRFTPQP